MIDTYNKYQQLVLETVSGSTRTHFQVLHNGALQVHLKQQLSSSGVPVYLLLFSNRPLCLFLIYLYKEELGHRS